MRQHRQFLRHVHENILEQVVPLDNSWNQRASETGWNNVSTRRKRSVPTVMMFSSGSTQVFSVSSFVLCSPILWRMVVPPKSTTWRTNSCGCPLTLHDTGKRCPGSAASQPLKLGWGKNTSARENVEGEEVPVCELTSRGQSPSLRKQ